MRILWMANPPWSPSGYGEQTSLFLPRFQAAGHDVAVFANYGISGMRMEWNGIDIYPSDGQWGNKALGTYAKHYKPDLIIALCDAWVLKPNEWPEGTEVAVWAPIDHYPIPPMVLAVLAHQRIRPVAMSRDGETWMRRFGLDPCYVPHGVDTSVFYPRPEIKQAVRRELGVPEDAFLVGMVAANKGNPTQPRKSWPQAFDAFAQFAQAHPDAWLYAHTEVRGDHGSGINLDTLAKAVQCDRISFADLETLRLGVPRESVAAIYNAFDVLLNPSMGEGFGIPIVEAQACGVPVIASDHSAMTELTQAGWLVTGDRSWDAVQESFFINPSVDSIRVALESAYERRNDVELRAAAVAAASEYDADRVTEEFWLPTLEALSQPREVRPLTVNTGPNRAARRKNRKVAA